MIASGRQQMRAVALTAAENLLTETADSVNPGTPAAELLRCVERYRAHLAVMVAAYRRPDVPVAVLVRDEP